MLHTTSSIWLAHEAEGMARVVCECDTAYFVFVEVLHAVSL
jgi:hypothetical protein